MSGPPPPPHLTSNYKQLLAQSHQGYTKPSPQPPPPPRPPNVSNYRNFSHHPKRHYGALPENSGHFQQQQTAVFAPQQTFEEPTMKRMRFESGTKHHNPQDSTTYSAFSQDDPLVIAKGEEIIKLLKQFPRPLSTKEIIKNCGHYCKLPLQPILHHLHDKGLIIKQYGFGLPAWKYNPNPPSPSQNYQYQQPQASQQLHQSPQNRMVSPPNPAYRPPFCSNQQQHQKKSWTSPQNTSKHQGIANGPAKPFKKTTSTKNFMISSDIYNALNKNPVSALNELVQKNGMTLTFELLCENPGSHKNRFTVSALIDGRMYDAVSSANMKDAKRDAADAALKVILKEHAVEEEKNQHPVDPATLTHFDHIATLSHRTFIDKSNMVQEKFAGRKIVACMIMKRDYDDAGKVISLGTGNRCITGQRLSMEGKVVNDSHAEIICRRAFISFLYTEIERHFANQDSIFEDDGYKGRSKVKDGVTFHLYISTAPCGDGALFTPRQNDTTPDFPTEHTPTFSAKSHGTLRTKIEDGEGTIPIDPKDAQQTFDGILRGQRLLTMSCSDKICRWNVVGMQGALLSHLIEPVYLDSLTLGYLYDHGHLSRAICCRLDKEDGQRLDDLLPMPYYLNHPWIGRVTQYEASRETEKTNNISINWSLHEQNPEVTDGRTGAQLTRTNGAPTPSRLCKLELIRRFQGLVSKSPKYKHLLDISTYRELKDKAEDFQKAKQCLMDRFKALRFGPWVIKPREQDMF